MNVSFKTKFHFTSVQICLCLWLIVMLFGCSSDVGFKPEPESSWSTNAEFTNTENGRVVPETALKFIDLPRMMGSNQVCEGEICVEDDVTVDKGGKIHLN